MPPSAIPSVAPSPSTEDVRLRAFGGEFRDAPLETAFQDARADETFRHSRVVLAAAVVLNLLFLFSDWRFVGTPHFWVAVPARLVVVGVALGCGILALRLTSRAALQRLMLAWMLLTAPAIGMLCSSQSEIALLVVVMLPAMYYLCVPVPFRSLVAGGSAACIATFIGYASGGLQPHIGLGLVLVLLMLKTALVLSVTRSNRVMRTTWLATRTEQRLRIELDRSRGALERMFTACPVPLVLTDRGEGTLLRMSDSCAELLGTTEPTTLLGLYAAPDAPAGLARALADGRGEAEFETVVRRPDGRERTLLVKAAELEIDGRAVLLAGLLDITQRKAQQTSLERLASTDPLTGLRNRLSFFAAARAEMLRASRGRTPLSLLMMDIDHFKHINDSFGHQSGDAALRAFAALCADQLGRHAIVGRLGGEEFGVLLPHVAPPGAVQIAEGLRTAAASMMVPTTGGAFVRLSVSIGVAGVRAEDSDIDGALARADLALYAAKNGGRNRVMLDEPASASRRQA